MWPTARKVQRHHHHISKVKYISLETVLLFSSSDIRSDIRGNNLAKQITDRIKSEPILHLSLTAGILSPSLSPVSPKPSSHHSLLSWF